MGTKEIEVVLPKTFLLQTTALGGGPYGTWGLIASGKENSDLQAASGTVSSVDLGPHRLGEHPAHRKSDSSSLGLAGHLVFDSVEVLEDLFQLNRVTDRSSV